MSIDTCTRCDTLVDTDQHPESYREEFDDALICDGCWQQCNPEDHCEHDWKQIRDWGGDPDVVGGTFEILTARCSICDEEADPSTVDMSDGDDFDYDDCRD